MVQSMLFNSMHYSIAIKYHLQPSLEIQPVKLCFIAAKALSSLMSFVPQFTIVLYRGSRQLGHYRCITYVNFLILNCFDVCY